MEYSDQDLCDLIYRSRLGKLDANEQKQLDAWLEYPENRELYHRIWNREIILGKMMRMEGYNRTAAWEQVCRKISGKRKISRKWYVYAAAVVLPLFILGVLFQRFEATQNQTVALQGDSIQPGTRNARIFLASGEVMELKKDTVYHTVTKDGMEIRNVDGFVSFENRQTPANEHIRYNRVETPRGGEYQVVLPDGTQVWLNAESSLRFPVAFSGNERRVYMTGEAFFDVTHRSGQPFLVESAGTTIRVLGTKFNVRAYQDLPLTTTLLSGKVQLQDRQQEVTLIPGQEAVLLSDGSGFQVKPANLEVTMAWLNGVFVFDNKPLEYIMQEVGRWYDVNVFFVNNRLQEERFSIEMPRHESFAEVLRLIEKTGVIHVEVKERTVFIR